MSPSTHLLKIWIRATFEIRKHWNSGFQALGTRFADVNRPGAFALSAVFNCKSVMRHSKPTVMIIATCLKYSFFRQQVSNKAIAIDYFVVYLGPFTILNTEHCNTCVALTWVRYSFESKSFCCRFGEKHGATPMRGSNHHITCLLTSSADANSSRFSSHLKPEWAAH